MDIVVFWRVCCFVRNRIAETQHDFCFKIICNFVKNNIMATKAKNTKLNKPAEKETDEKTPVKVSKTWLAAMANKGTGKILDMRAVLK
jgi:hypothetical protein